MRPRLPHKAGAAERFFALGRRYFRETRVLAILSTQVRFHFKRVVRHGFWIALAVLGEHAVRTLAPRALLLNASQFAGDFIQTFGGMYGVIVAFAMYVVWQEHNETQVTIEREATSLAELFRLVGFMPGWGRSQAVRGMLLEYAATVPRVNDGARAGDSREDRELLDAAFGELLGYAPAEPHEQRLYEGALGLFRQVKEAREHRETVANLRLPHAMRWFVFIGAGISVAAMWLVWLESELIAALLTASMTWVVVAASTILIDLDNPYEGDFVVHWRRFHAVADRMRAMHCPDARA